MKREIKFRGWRRKYQCWEYGYLIECAAPELNEIVEVIKHGGRIIAAVERDSIGQYTGIKDKNGREVYEGDIVKYHMVRSYGDRYDPVTFGFIGTDWDVDADIIGKVSIWPSNGVMMTNIITDDPDMFCKKYPVPKRWHVTHDCEVIGNIFENPELLEEKQ